MTKATILNTRPISYSKQTSNAFIKKDFNVINFPCIELIESNDSNKCQNLLDQIKPEGAVIFTSPQSVVFAFQILPDLGIPPSTVIIAVGTKTAQYLEQYIENNIYVPESHNSQGIIDLLKGLKNIQSISLISGTNGRQVIQDYAKDNKIDLTEINVYKRQLPELETPIDWINSINDVCVLATSITTLENLKLLLDDNYWSKLQNNLVVCASIRIEKYANKLGFTNTLNTDSANPVKMAQKLSQYLSNNKL